VRVRSGPGLGGIIFTIDIHWLVEVVRYCVSNIFHVAELF